jgi:hypothetical protein
MIQQKKKICKNCQTEQYIFSKGRCQKCATIEDSKPLKRGSTIKKQTDKNKANRKSQFAIREVYFSYHIERCKVSEESGVNIHNPNRANICHLFPKSKHPSVQDSLGNVIYLTIQEHTDFDKLLFENDFEGLCKKMPNAWKIASSRMVLLLPEVKEETKFKNKFEEWIQLKQLEID